MRLSDVHHQEASFVFVVFAHPVDKKHKVKEREETKREEEGREERRGGILVEVLNDGVERGSGV